MSGKVLVPLRLLGGRPLKEAAGPGASGIRLADLTTALEARVPLGVHRVSELVGKAGGSAGPAVAQLSELTEQVNGGDWTPSLPGSTRLADELRGVMAQLTSELAATLAPSAPNSPPGPPSGVAYTLQRSLAPAWTEVTRLGTLLRYYDAAVTTPDDDEVWAQQAPVAPHNLRDAVSSALIDVEALCNEKHGVVPPVSLIGCDTATAICDRNHLHFVLLELLKNAFSSTISKYGIDADEAPPITVAIGPSLEHPGLQINDRGDGLAPGVEKKCFDFFYTTVPYVEPTYTFSGNFGGELEGRGVGLPLAQAILSAYKGTITLGSTSGYGTTAFVNLTQTANL